MARHAKSGEAPGSEAMAIQIDFLGDGGHGTGGLPGGKQDDAPRSSRFRQPGRQTGLGTCGIDRCGEQLLKKACMPGIPVLHSCLLQMSADLVFLVTLPNGDAAG